MRCSERATPSVPLRGCPVSDPTPNNERRWVCVNEVHYGLPCNESTPHSVCARYYAAPVPSPVPSRPDTAKLREPGYLAGSAIWAQRRKEAADWIDAQPAADQGPDLSEAAALLDEYDQSVHNLTRFGTVEAQTDHLLASERVAAFARRLLDREGGT